MGGGPLPVSVGSGGDQLHTRKIKKTYEQQRKVLEAGQDACREGILKVLKEGEPNWDDLILGHD